MEKVISYVGTNRGDGQKASLHRLRELLERLNNPHKNLHYIHITGSNGKGSTASIFQSVLREAGLNVGLFTSPHLECINERIRVNNEYINNQDLIRLINEMEPVILELEMELNEKFYAFELLTALSFLYFQEKKPDIIILEAGIGGRLDATNVIEESELAVITSIGIDHTSVLGPTKEAIMKEKVQILKENGQMVIGPISANLQSIAKAWSQKVDGDVLFIDRKDITSNQQYDGYQLFNYKSYQQLKLSFLGAHQVENAVLVIEGAKILAEKGYSISSEVIYKGLAKAYWPGRFEKILDQPLFYIDGAHNVASVERLIETLTTLFPEEKFHFVVGMMKDKAYKEMLEKVYPLAKEFILMSPDPVRGFDTKEVAELIRAEKIKVKVVNEVDDLFSYVIEEIPQDEIVIQFGSLYLVGILKEQKRKIQEILTKPLKS